jgi:hypothetical protein
MSVQHPIIKYRLTRDGRVPEYLCTDHRAFGGMYGVDTNTPGYIARWPSPQETQFLGMGCGPVDPEQGAPAGVSVVETKEELQTYITGISTAWTVDTSGVTGIRTETTTGTLEAWNAGPDYVGPGLTTTTTPEVTFAPPAGTIIIHDANYVTKIVVETATSSGVTTSVQEFPMVYPYTNITIVGVSTVVGVVTTTGPEQQEVTITTSTTTTAATHEDITEGYSDSISTTDVDGAITKTRTRVYSETTKVRNPFDPVAATNELWSIYEVVNGITTG